MGKVLSIINVKGGVGKSTVTMMLAEALAVVHGKRVLVVDSDPQTSLSLMLADKERILEVEKDKKTILDFILKATPKNRQKMLTAMVMAPVSDVVGAHSLHLLPGNYRLFYVERIAGKMPTKKKLYDRIQHLAAAARDQFDVILIDCPPGYSELSDAWLLHSDYYLTPVAPNFLSTRALSVLRKICKQLGVNGNQLAKNLGVLVNFDERTKDHVQTVERLHAVRENRCFSVTIPKNAKNAVLERAAQFQPGGRAFRAKYKSPVDGVLGKISAEVLARMRDG